MKAYHITTPFWAEFGTVGGGFACAIRLHREVKPESGLTLYEIFDMKACRITTLFWGRGAGRGGGREV